MPFQNEFNNKEPCLTSIVRRASLPLLNKHLVRLAKLQNNRAENVVENSDDHACFGLRFAEHGDSHSHIFDDGLRSEAV